MMLGFPPPLFFQICWRFISPAIIFVSIAVMGHGDTGGEGLSRRGGECAGLQEGSRAGAEQGDRGMRSSLAAPH